MSVRPNLKYPALILKASGQAIHHGDLAVARSLGQLGAPVYAVVTDRCTPVAASRYLKGSFVWKKWPKDRRSFVDAMLAIGESLGRRLVLIPTDDLSAIYSAENAAELARWFILPRVRPDVPRRMADKVTLYALCKEIGIPIAPITMPCSMDDIYAIAEDWRFPVVVKTAEQWTPLHDRFSTTIISSASELIAFYRRLDNLKEPRSIVQQYVRGEDWITHGYYNSDRDVRLTFAGRKLLGYPLTAGSTALGLSAPNETLRRQTENLVGALSYSGIVDIDWRRDEVDGQYKILDCNPRIGMNFRMFETSKAVDVARAQYLDLTGKGIEEAPMVAGRIFRVESFCLLARVRRMYRPRTPDVAASRCRQYTELAWWKSDDPLPFFIMTVRMPLNVFRRLCWRAFSRSLLFWRNSIDAFRNPLKRDPSGTHLESTKGAFEKFAANAALRRIRQRRQISAAADSRPKERVVEGCPTLRAAKPSDFQSVSFLKKRYGIVADPLENWTRLWRENPVLARMKSTPSMGWVLESKGKLVGYLGNICLAYRYGERHLSTAVGSGLVVEPSYRVFTIHLIEAFFRQNGFDLYLGTTAIEPVAKLARCFGSDPLPQQESDKVFFWVLRRYPFARAMTEKLQFSKPMSVLAEVFVSSALAADGIVRRQTPKRFSTGFSISESSINEIGEEVEALWLGKLEEQTRVFADRTMPALRWHFDVPGFKGTIRVIYCHRAGELVGYAVVRNNCPGENGLRRSILADIMAKRDDPEVLQALLVGCWDHAERTGAHIFEVGCVPPEVQRLCVDSKAYVRTLPGRPFYYKASDPELHRALSSSAAWYASPYDGDTTLMPEISPD